MLNHLDMAHIISYFGGGVAGDVMPPIARREMPAGVKQENGGVKFLAIPEVGEIETNRLGRNGFWMANVRGDEPRGTLECRTGIRITGKRRNAARGETEIVGFRVDRPPAARRVLVGQQIVARLGEKRERFTREVFQHDGRPVDGRGFVFRPLVAEPKGQKRTIRPLCLLEKTDTPTHRPLNLFSERILQQRGVE